MATATVRSNVFDLVPAQRGPNRLARRLERLARWSGWQPAAWAGSAEEQVRREAAHVRRLADQVRSSNPGFAADLDAAVLRHEAKHELAL